ncbi:ChaB family protein [Nocardia arthritidis]|uniref:ChaB family protein n=1 Tax=Nocardia arthritidis TaxID=228602 RepID=UPI0007A485F4|nr:ChaB family protein [Nocardia arthritidis]
MPKTTARGDVEQSELPSTLQRSEEKAQRTFAEAHDAALQQYDGDEQRAYRVAYAALKSKEHLLDIARRLDIAGRSRMTTDELVEALEKRNRRESARARG